MRRWHAAALLILLCACAEFSAVFAARDRKYYDALGVPPDADEAAIKKAYRKAAL